MRIRYLPETLINQIAAGEVLERPAAAVKELIENSIDAKANEISIDLLDGGKSKIIITDNGCGMSKNELAASIDRHATSKLPDDDLLNIRHLGFRGEALASIAAVSRLSIDTHDSESGQSWNISCEAGRKSEIKPAKQPKGTRITIKDLFFATPARLKFQKSSRIEYTAIKDIITRLAMAYPEISFRLTNDGEQKLNLYTSNNCAQRLSNLLGRDFESNSITVNAQREGVQLSGYASLPTYHKGINVHQYLFVNGRTVRDKLLQGCVRAAYTDVLARDRHPVVALFLTCPPEEVDVNVHPAKAEVRFRDPQLIRGLIISALKNSIHENGFQVSKTINSSTIKSFTFINQNYSAQTFKVNKALSNNTPLQEYSHVNTGKINNSILYAAEPSARIELIEDDNQQPELFPLGTARAQLHENYIVAQTKTGIVLVDQHAAHERLTYERLKAQFAESGIKKQGLLIPEIVSLNETQIFSLLEHNNNLQKLGLEIEPFGNGAIAVQATPAILGTNINVKQLIEDIADELQEQGNTQSLEIKINAILSRISCHGSIRSGRRMSAEEMNSLLRQMETSPLSGQCNHGRPTYIELSLKDIERLFGRS